MRSRLGLETLKQHLVKKNFRVENWKRCLRIRTDGSALLRLGFTIDDGVYRNDAEPWLDQLADENILQHQAGDLLFRVLSW